MQKIKEFFQKKGMGYAVNLISMVLGIVGLICYLASAEDQSFMTDTHISVVVIVLFAAALCLNVGVAVFDKGFLKLLAFAAYFAVMAAWIFTQAGYIVNVLMGIDKNIFSFGYILSFVCIIACIVLSLVSRKRKKDREA